MIKTNSKLTGLWSLAFVVAIALFVSPSARAATVTWTQLSGGNASGSWNTAANPPWSTGALPGSGDIADFSTLNITADSTVTLDGNQSINSLIFGNTNGTPANNWIVSSGTPGTSTLTLSGTTPTITVNPLGTNQTVTISAVIAGTVSLTKSGTGTLVLSGDNTNTGTTSVGAGALTLSANRTATASTFAVGSVASSTGTLNIQGNLTLATGANQINAGGTNTGVGIINQTGGSVGFSDTVSIGVVVGQALGGTGTYNLSAGTLTPPSTSGVGINLCNNNSTTGTFNLSGSGNLAAGSSTVNVGRFNITSVTGTTPTFNQTGGTATIGTLFLGGKGQNCQATLNLTGGTFTVTTFGGILGNANKASNVAMTVGGTSIATLPAFPVKTTGNTATFTFDGGTLVVGAASASYMQAVTFDTATITSNGGTIQADSGKDATIAQIFGGAGGFTKTGTGTLTLTGANTYTGTTTVSAGTLAGTGTLSNSSLSVTGGTVAPGTPGGATGTFTATTADFSGGGTLKVRVTTGSAHDKLTLTSTTALKMGGTSALVVDMSGFLSTDPNGTYLLAETQNWNTSAGFSSVTIINNTSGKTAQVSYVANASTAGITSYVNSAYTAPYIKQLVLDVGRAVTPVKIADFAAKSEGAGVNVSWTSVSEYQNAGFNIYRRAMESAEWVKVNPTLIAGRITNPDEKKYAYFDWASAGIYEYKLESVDLFGVREEYAKLSDVVDVDWMSAPSDMSVGVIDSAIRSIDMDVSAKTAQRVETIFAAVRTADANVGQKTNASDKVTVREFDARSISVVSVANNVVDRSVVSAAKVLLPAVSVRWFSSGRIDTSSNFTAAKVTYKDAGVMLIPQASMPAGFDLNQVSIQREGRNMNALAKVQGGLMVYAPGYKDNYTDKDALFLRKTTHPTSTGTPSTATGLFSSAMPVNVTSSNVVKNDYHDVYFDYGFRPYSFEPWFSNKYLTQGSTQDFTVSLPNAVNSAANLVVNVWSLTSSESVTPDHGIQVLVNGRAVGEASWDGGGKMLQIAFTLPAGALKSGDNTVSLITPTLSGQDSQIALLHSISVSYTRALDGSRPIEITNASSMASLYEIYNVPNGGAWVVDARFTDRASLVPAETLLQADGTLRLRFVAAADGSGKFLIVPVGQENKPLTIGARQVKPLNFNGTYLATGPSQFASGVQPLLVKRSKEGIRSAFVDQEQLFDYYNYGRFGPDGIRKAVRSVRPSYLLLVGRTTYDYLNYSGANIDPLCPAFLVSTHFWAQTTSDSAFGDFGRGYPEVSVGRLPVNNTAELSGAVRHILGYKGMPASGMRLHAVADRPDAEVANFGAELDTMVRSNHSDITWQENYLERTYQTPPEVTAAMKSAANGGADLILYSGHGNSVRLGKAPLTGDFNLRILDLASVQEWTGNTVLLQGTCAAHWMAKNEQDYKSIAIQALTQPQGGISASIGTSTYMNPDVATAFMNQLLKNTNGTGARWGTVLLKTQQWAGKQSGSAFYTDLMNTEQLFGDPAMPVNAPKSSATTQNSPAAGTF
ncbi:MAG: C25 family cysteine peptidase [Planctomycetota bacterium]